MSDEVEGEIVHLLIGSDAYYPRHDNTLRVIRSKECADEICEELNEVGGPDWVDEWNALRDTYEWLPKNRHQRYTVEPYEVNDGDL